MQLFPTELALANLKGEISPDERGHCSKEEAYEELKWLSGEDFGLDIELWETWVLEDLRSRVQWFSTRARLEQKALASALRTRFSKADIRSDSNKAVHVITPTLAAVCSFEDGGYKATIISRDPIDNSDEVLTTLKNITVKELLDALAKLLEA